MGVLSEEGLNQRVGERTMTKRGKPQRERLKRGELLIHALRYTKAELAAVPAQHRSFYLVLGHCLNESAMLQTLLARAIKGVQSPAVVVQETSLGLAFFLTRLLAGRVHEARLILNAEANRLLLDEIWDGLEKVGIDDQGARKNAADAKKRLNVFFGNKSLLLPLIRNKQAFHTDQSVLDAAFATLPNDMPLADYHTGQRGTTFYGTADTVAAFATSHLAGEMDVLKGMSRLNKDALNAARALADFGEGYALAFSLNFFGVDKLRSSDKVLLKGLPEAGSASLQFFMAKPSEARMKHFMKKVEGEEDDEFEIPLGTV